VVPALQLTARGLFEARRTFARIAATIGRTVSRYSLPDPASGTPEYDAVPVEACQPGESSSGENRELRLAFAECAIVGVGGVSTWDRSLTNWRPKH
jgi:hypothetical protein